MEKTYKRVPFDIELAKKIQSGEVEGRIVTKDNHSVRIVCFDKKIYPGVDSYPIVALVDFINFEHAYTFFNSGICEYIGAKGNYDLYIELPEEAPKHEFKVGDKVKVVKLLFDSMFDGAYLGKEFVIKEVNNGYYTIGKDGWKNNHFLECCLELVNEEKHEFKPFDKVLVRDSSLIWTPKIISREGIIEGAKKVKCYITTDGGEYIAPLPYEGNEYLVGTTNNPKED